VAVLAALHVFAQGFGAKAPGSRLRASALIAFSAAESYESLIVSHAIGAKQGKRLLLFDSGIHIFFSVMVAARSPRVLAA